MPSPSSSVSSPTSPTASSSSASRTFASLVEEERPLQAASVAMEGGMPSCIKLFDHYLSCYCELRNVNHTLVIVRVLTPSSFGRAAINSQTRSLYRHGTVKDCSPQFKEFKFCLSLKAQTTEERDAIWVQRRSEMWARRRMEKNSEDVWEARKNVYDDSSVDKVKEWLGNAR
ncbi:BZ3500_MvSof-1268-A1-R1_Chr1-1g00927 [Microbotryum saponariae]|uniref:BZ3500_MvSof-1268-A1-R1_Chr1-1g00927 protein n=1 Tax=Microbotryum saponariae TaxID=289078 RepID=A0A2X0L0L2_9BASI|nr:BZ3500_MvSof-1268-A1-R1_Chr1-1g00927 [Microbotryum saponariae]SCZ92956.1 BZ3501_MvSof-1269-A2-R1_Chr1-1g00524 [Microbotryum saponariae]